MNNYSVPRPAVSNSYSINDDTTNLMNYYSLNSKLNNIQREIKKLNEQNLNNITCTYYLFIYLFV